MSFYSKEELDGLGLAHYGENVLISKKSSIYNAGQISIGNNVRIDDYCVLSAGDGVFEIGNQVHIAPFCSLIGKAKIILKDFSGLSSRVTIFSSSDDFTGNYLTNPMVPEQFKNVTNLDVILEKHVIVGTGSVVLPGVRLEEGVAIGALSLVTKSCSAFGIFAGRPAKRIKNRNKSLLKLEKMFLMVG